MRGASGDLVVAERRDKRTLEWVLLLRRLAVLVFVVVWHALTAREVFVELMPPQRQIR